MFTVRSCAVRVLSATWRRCCLDRLTGLPNNERFELATVGISLLSSLSVASAFATDPSAICSESDVRGASHIVMSGAGSEGDFLLSPALTLAPSTHTSSDTRPSVEIDAEPVAMTLGVRKRMVLRVKSLLVGPRLCQKYGCWYNDWPFSHGCCR